MISRVKFQIATSLGVLIAYGFLATGALRALHGPCAAGGCQDAPAFLQSQGSDHHGDSDGGSHSPDCPICHQLTVASSATLQFASAAPISAADLFLIHFPDDPGAAAQTVCTTAAPRAPPFRL